MQAAFYEKEITPPLGSSIPGYFNLRLGSGVKDRLYARSVVFKTGDKAVAIVAVDGCSVAEAVYKRVTARIEEFTQIKPENVAFAYVHTHTGIPLLTENPDDADPKAREAQKGYLDVVSKLIADCVTLAYQRLEECTLSFGCGDVHGISFCRDYIMKNSTPRTNPPRTDPNIERQVAEIDPQLPVLFVRDKEGKPMGALYGFGCHLDCVDGTEYSGDFPCVAEKELKKQYGNDFVGVFLMGASGNVNHFDVTRKKDAPDHYVMMGKVVAGEFLKTVASAKPVEDETLDVSFKKIKINRTEISEEKIERAKHIVATVKMAEGIKLAADGTDAEQYELGMSKKLLETLKKPEQFDVPLQVIRIGNFILYAMPAEIYLEFSKMLKETVPTDKYMVATMCNAAIGYVPTRDMFYDTIYPARIGSNLLSHEAGYIMVEELEKMGKSLFGKDE